jgi:hypothetical protein
MLRMVIVTVYGLERKGSLKSRVTPVTARAAKNNPIIAPTATRNGRFTVRSWLLRMYSAWRRLSVKKTIPGTS